MTNTERKIVDHMLALQAELDAERDHRHAETQRADRERARRLAAESCDVCGATGEIDSRCGRCVR